MSRDGDRIGATGGVRIETHDAEAGDEIRLVEDRLYGFNTEATGIRDGRFLRVLARDDADRLVGAATGHTWGGTCEIRQLWVDAPRRRAGLGSELLARAEAEARARGCRQIVLSTHSFQAPELYRRLGFERLGEVPDYPEGHRQILLRKPLDGA